MRILLAGGGSGGHVTPLRAISESLKLQAKQPLSITVITDRGFYSTSKDIFANDPQITLKKIFSGKYRRYKSKSFWWHVTHIPTVLKNVRDVFLLGLGVIQTIIYFFLQKPDVVFCKGGFVCIPIGIGAKLFKVPLIIHDSDTRPGLTNRILARWASKIGTGMPTSFYPYAKKRMVYTGIPVQTQYKPMTATEQQQYKVELGFEPDKPLVLLTGGGNGSVPLNKLLIADAPKLTKQGWNIVHLTGKGKSAAAVRARKELSDEAQKQWRIEEFAPMVPRLLAADVVVSRTSASTLQECANAQKTVIGVASPHLDDQKMNAEFFASKKAIISLDELSIQKDDASLVQTVVDLKKDSEKAVELAHNLHKNFAKPLAAKEIAGLILESAASS